MMRIVSLSALFLVAAVSCAQVPQPRFSCQECVDEMHNLGRLVRAGGRAIEQYLREEYCPTLGEHQEQCEDDLAHNYVAMLFMIVQHYFVDGAIHICMAWNVCNADATDLMGKDPRPYTCEECVEGLEMVEAYMNDPLWVAEYTLYLQQNFCYNGGRNCEQIVATHFPVMHQMAMDQFFKPQDLCDMQPVCGGTMPPRPSTPAPQA